MTVHSAKETAQDSNIEPTDIQPGSVASSRMRDSAEDSYIDPDQNAHATLADMVEGLADLQALTKGARDVCIAVLDGPFDDSHPVLRGSLVNAHGDYSGARPPSAALKHGTAVASLLFGQPGSAIEGIAPNCRGLFIPIYPHDEQGNLLSCSQFELARAIELAASAGAHVINISGGELGVPGEIDPVLKRAIDECERRGILVVAAAGNDACDCVHMPAALSWVVVVGAMDLRGIPLTASNWGEAYRGHGLLALGHRVPVALPKSAIGRLSGTSFAAPIVSGVAALFLSLLRGQSVSNAAQVVRKALLDGARRCSSEEGVDCRRYLTGSLDVASTWKLIQANMRNAEHEPSTDSTYRVTKMPTTDTQNAVAPSSTGLETSGDQLPDGPVSSIVTGESSRQGRVEPSLCHACEGGLKPGAETPAPGWGESACVYALGSIEYTFASDSRRDSVAQLIGVNDPEQVPAFLAHLEKNPYIAEKVIWTLTLDSTPIWAIVPMGPYASTTYSRLFEFLRLQQNGSINRVSIPGTTQVGSMVRTRQGHTIPVLVPDLRGMHAWTTETLVSRVVGKAPTDAAGKELYAKKVQRIHQFLERVYYELRNPGISPADRALNYAATNAFQIEQVFAKALIDSLELESMRVEKNPMGRPGSNLWTVILTFFNPLKRFETAKMEFRYDVDVDDCVAIAVGPVRSWATF